MAPRIHSYQSAYGGRAYSATTAAAPSTIIEAEPAIHRPLGYEWATVGAAVQLRKDSNYTPDFSNPTQGSRYACEGVITHVKKGPPVSVESRAVKVAWNNDTHNDYFYADLEPYDDSLWGGLEHLLGEKEEEKKGPMFNKGDVVFLKPGFKTPHHEQPALGTFFQCPGTIVSAEHAKVKVRVIVKWHNSLRCTYIIRYDTEKNPDKCMLINAEDIDALKRFVEENPNFAYKVRKGTQKDSLGVFDFFRPVMGIEEELPESEMQDDYHTQYFAGSDEAEVEPEETRTVVLEPGFVTFNYDTPSWNATHEFLDESRGEDDGENE